MLAFGALTRYRREVVTVDTGYVAVNSGNTTYVNIPAGTLLSVQVRWKGWQKTETSTTSTSDSTSGSKGAAEQASAVLTAPVGSGSLVRVSASASVSAGASDSWQVIVTPGGQEFSNSGTGTSGSVSGTNYSPGGSRSAGFAAAHGQPYSYSFSVTATWETSDTYQTQNPRITVGGQATQYTGTLNNGVESSYVSANGFAAGSNNAVAHNISGSARAYVQIVVQVLV